MEHGNAVGPGYGPAANLKTVFDTWRNRSMPEQVTKDWLERIGISSNLTAKNQHSLRFLGLIDGDDYPTDTAQRLRAASSEEYAGVLEQIIRKAYSRMFETRNPSEDSRTRVEDAFRNEYPVAQRKRMLACFLGLCAMAGIPLKEAPPARETQSRTTAPRRPKPEASVPTRRDRQELEASNNRPSRPSVPSSLDPVLVGLINTIPQIETVTELEEWYSVFRSAFTYVHNMKAKTKNEGGP